MDEREVFHGRYGYNKEADFIMLLSTGLVMSLSH